VISVCKYVDVSVESGCGVWVVIVSAAGIEGFL